MSRDIRSFFAPVKAGAKKEKVNESSGKSNKKRVFNISESDDDGDDFVSKPTPKKVKNDSTSKKTASPRKEAEKPKSKPVAADSFFGSAPVQQKPQTLIKPGKSAPPETTTPKDESKKHKSKKRKKEEVKEISLENHFDDDFEATLMNIDEEVLGITPKKQKVSPAKDERKIAEVPKVDSHMKTPDEKTSKHADGSYDVHRSKKSAHGDEVPEKNKKTPDDKKSRPEKEVSNSSKKIKSPDKVKTSAGQDGSSKLDHKKTPESKKQKSVEESKEVKTPANENATPTASSSKKSNAEAYQRFLQRSGPRNPGSKLIPEGSPTCLEGKSFVLTGVLESMERDEAADLIKKCGGRVTSTVSKKTSYVVLGEEPGESKLKKAEQFKTQQLSEDGLLELIQSLSKSAEKPSKVEEESKYFSKSKEKVDVKKDSREKKRKTPEKTKKEARPISPVTVDSGIGSMSPVRSPPKITSPKLESAPSHSLGDMLWVDKYKPKITKNIIGQNGDKSNVKKLTKWLNEWHKNHDNSNQKKARPAPWAQNDDGSYFKAALLSGPPGVGKTTSVHLICQELGFHIIEFNASDTRSKKLLGEQVAELLGSKSITSFYSKADDVTKKNHVLVMDEVDGMAGNEDRGGIQELIQLIKNTKTPIICMCNDRSHPKIRSLVNYCYDLRFHRPRVEQIKAAMMSVCFKEGIKIPNEALVNIITCANQDVRQVLHNLSLWAVKDKQMTNDQVKIDADKAKKALKMGPWDVARQVFSQSDQERTSLRDKEDLFFQDYSLGPLFVQDTYVHVKPFRAKGNKVKTLECLSKAADSLAWGDVIEKTIRSQNAWGLLPVQAYFSSVIPGHEMAGHVMGQISFPAWLGKNSKRGRMDRLLQELHVHTRLSTSGSKQAVNLDYNQYLRDAIVSPLARNGPEGIPKAIEVMKNYQLLREDLDSLVELTQWPNRHDPYASIDSKVKAAFTRAYNKESLATPYAASNLVKKTKSDDAELLEALTEDGEEGVARVSDDEQEDDVSTDAMIKKGKAGKKTSGGKESSSSAAASRSNDKKERKPPSRKGKSK